MLEVIEADLSRMEAESKSAEAAAKKEHDAFMEARCTAPGAVTAQ